MRDAPLTGPPDPSGPRRSGEGGRRVRAASGSRRAVLLPLLVLLVGGGLTGCATKGDLRNVRGEIQELQASQDSLFQLLLRLERATQDSLRAQSDVLFSLRGDLNRQLLDVQEQLVTIQELTGQSQRSLAGLRDQLEARRNAAQRPPPAGPTPDTTEAGGEPGGAQPAEAGGAMELYNVARRQFNRGSNTTARRAFERFLESYPNHRLAPDAHFFLADILSQEAQGPDGDLREEGTRQAIERFLEIPELFPASSRVPEALYRAGLLHMQLEENDEARSLFERVVNSYPETTAANLAQMRLDELP